VGGSGLSEETGVAGKACAAKLNEAAPAVLNACPAAKPEAGSPCDDQAENSICVWQAGDPTGNARSYRALGCYAGLKGKIWLGGDEMQSGRLGPLDEGCPKQPPVLGATCATLDAMQGVETCVYPADYCECSSISPGRWLCTNALGGQLSPPKPALRVCAPASFDEAQQVKDMGPNLTAAWCDWLSQLTGKKIIATGKDSPGVADSYGFQGITTPELKACLPFLPADFCVQNLDSRGANCTATVAELDDCVETILSVPNGGWVGHGCAPVLANPTCAGVIVQTLSGDANLPSGSPGAAECIVPLQ